MKDSLLNNIEINAIKDCEERSCLSWFEWDIQGAVRHEEELHNVKLNKKTFNEICMNVAKSIKDKFICISDAKEDSEEVMIYVNKKMYYEELVDYISEIALNYNEDTLNDLEAEVAEDGNQTLENICEDAFLEVCEDRLPGYRLTKYELKSEAYKQFLADAKKEAIKYLELFVRNAA